MRISDWSSDVCSSDLCADSHSWLRPCACSACCPCCCCSPWPALLTPTRRRKPCGGCWTTSRWTIRRRSAKTARWSASSNTTRCTSSRQPRSEEHTSELQSLMRISYAVFCLKKKTEHNHDHN